MNRKVQEHRSGILVAAIAVLVNCQPVAVAASADNLKIIPRPAIVEPGEGVFVLTRQTPIAADGSSVSLKRMSLLLRDAVRTQTGMSLTLKDAKTTVASSGGGISLLINAQPTELGTEGYELMISPERVTVRADEEAGIFYGIQSLVQMLSPALSANPGAPATDRTHLSALRIVDRPRFAWRGLLLDCSRTFLALEYLKKCVDVCSFYKMNVLQLHLTDD